MQKYVGTNKRRGKISITTRSLHIFPMISIVIPVHNERPNLQRLLPYLKGLDAPCEVEILVALSNETHDGSCAFHQPPDIRSIRCQGKGRALQMNTAADRAMGDILVFLHADVLPPLSFFQDIVDALDYGCQAGFFSYRFDTESFWLRVNSSFTAKDGLFTGGGDQCLFIRKSVFLALGKYDEQQLLMEDFEFFRRMKRNRISYTIVKKNLMVSARKYRKNSYLRVNLSNLLLLVLFRSGCPSKILKSLHGKLLKGHDPTVT